MPADDPDDLSDSSDSLQIDRRQARHQHEWELFQLLEQVPVGVVVATGAGKPYYANAQARLLLGIDAVPDHVSRFSEVYHAFEIGTDRPYPAERLPLTRALAGERCEVSDIELRRNGHPIPLHASGAPVKIASEIAFAVMALQDVRELRRMVMLDALTGLPNRTALAESFARERLRPERSNAPISLAMIDFDHFKHVNDAFGHAAGDEVLRRGSTAIVQALRHADVVSRWGGEELLVMLPGTRIEVACDAIEQALADVRALQISVAGSSIRITFSAGIVEADDAEALDEVVERADAALYQAKHAGRNRVVAARRVAPAKSR
jgi:diguanylate cyclase (GGDEF)-like protein